MKKIRKPRDLFFNKTNRPMCMLATNFLKDSKIIRFYSFPAWLDLKAAKKLHAWLGRAIKYLEQEKVKK